MKKHLLAFLAVILLSGCSHDHHVLRFDKDAWQAINDKAKGHVVSIESPGEKYDVKDFVIQDSVAIFRSATGAEYTPLDSINRIAILSSTAGAEDGAVTGAVVLTEGLLESRSQEQADLEAKQVRRHESDRIARQQSKSATAGDKKPESDDDSSPALIILILFGLFILGGALIGAIAKSYDYYTLE